MLTDIPTCCAKPYSLLEVQLAPMSDSLTESPSHLSLLTLTLRLTTISQNNIIQGEWKLQWRSGSPGRPTNNNCRCGRLWIWLRNGRIRCTRLTLPVTHTPTLHCDLRKFIQAYKLRLVSSYICSIYCYCSTTLVLVNDFLIKNYVPTPENFSILIISKTEAKLLFSITDTETLSQFGIKLDVTIKINMNIENSTKKLLSEKVSSPFRSKPPQVICTLKKLMPMINQINHNVNDNTTSAQNIGGNPSCNLMLLTRSLMVMFIRLVTIFCCGGLRTSLLHFDTIRCIILLKPSINVLSTIIKPQTFQF